MDKFEYKEEFVQGFIAAMCFADSPEDSQGEWDESNLDPECLEVIEAICTIFLSKCAHVVAKVPDLSNSDLCHWVSAGADLYYTMVGHGVGYWETDKYPEREEDGAVLGVYLHSVAKDMPYFAPYFDDEEMVIYC